MKEQTTRTPPKLRILSAFLAVAMLLTLLPAAAFADDPPGWYYTKDGVKYFNDINSTVWQVYKYEGSAAEISLPETINDGNGRNYYVGAIRQKAFQDNTRITGVTFPGKVLLCDQRVGVFRVYQPDNGQYNYGPDGCWRESV